MQKLEEGILIEGPDILCFISIEYVPQVDDQKVLQQGFETKVRRMLLLRNRRSTNEE